MFECLYGCVFTRWCLGIVLSDLTSVIEIPTVRQQFSKKTPSVVHEILTVLDSIQLASCHSAKNLELEAIPAFPCAAACVTRSSRSNATASLRA
jgi:hypothetical protein